MGSRGQWIFFDLDYGRGKWNVRVVPDYFAAAHRWHHYAWLAEHFEYVRQPEQARQMRQLAERWEAIVQELESSVDRWSSGLLD